MRGSTPALTHTHTRTLSSKTLGSAPIIGKPIWEISLAVNEAYTKDSFNFEKIERKRSIIMEKLRSSKQKWRMR